MKSPYRVGFEIVHHNDDNTRLVGIFVFRVNKDLYYAPVFFINGNASRGPTCSTAIPPRALCR